MSAALSISAVRTMSSHKILSETHRRCGGRTPNSDMKITELADLLQSKLAEFQRGAREDVLSMEDVLQVKLGSFYSDVNSEINKIREESARISNTLKTSIDSIAHFVDSALQRLNRLNNLVITGVPYVRGENLMAYFNDWCRALGYPHQRNFPVVAVQRMPKRNTAASRSPVIILRFAMGAQRNEFFCRYLRTCSLSLRSIGFSSNKRIYVNEDLGPKERMLRSKALRLKKRGILCKVFSRNGIVFVQSSSTNQTIAVTSTTILEQMMNTIRNIK